MSYDVRMADLDEASVRAALQGINEQQASLERALEVTTDAGPRLMLIISLPSRFPRAAYRAED